MKSQAGRPSDERVGPVDHRDGALGGHMDVPRSEVVVAEHRRRQVDTAHRVGQTAPQLVTVGQDFEGSVEVGHSGLERYGQLLGPTGWAVLSANSTSQSPTEAAWSVIASRLVTAAMGLPGA